jgi:hypothetical protein
MFCGFVQMKVMKAKNQIFIFVKLNDYIPLFPNKTGVMRRGVQKQLATLNPEKILVR